MKKFSAVALLLLSVACTSMTGNSTGSGNDAAGSTMARVEPTHYFLLSDPKAVREIDWSNPQRLFHVKVRPNSAGYTIVGQVEGSGRFCADGKDWFSLADGKVHSAGEGTPVAPYIMGCKTASGGLQPSSREIVQ